jgi:hypothetical protein
VTPKSRVAAPIAAWSRFFFAPQSPLNIGAFRIVYGALVAITILLMHADWLSWYGPHSWITAATMHVVEPGTRINLFDILPATDSATSVFFWIFLAAALCLAAGFCTRAASIVVYLCLTSIDQRNLFILHGGDTFLRVSGFFLIFAPAGDALSVDRWLRIRRGRESADELKPRAPCAQRMIQLELAFMYLISFWWKLKGGAWLDGTALYYVFHLDEFQRFPVPQFLLHPALLRVGSWAALIVELALGTLIWVKKFRYPLLLIGMAFHLSLEYALNVPMFQWDVLSAYILFVEPQDLSRFLARFTHREADAAVATA